MTDPKNEPMHRAIQELLRDTAGVTGQAFFEALARTIARVLGTRQGFVGSLAPDRPGWIRSLAFWSGQRFEAPFEYELRGTPCAEVLLGTPCFIESDAERRFPEDRLLVGVQSYFGTPLGDFQGRVRGVMVGLDQRPHVPPDGAGALLELFGVRAAAELERMDGERQLRDRNAELESMLGAFPDRYFWVDADRRIRRALAAGTSTMGPAPSGWEALVPITVAPRLEQAVQQVQANPQEVRLEYDLDDHHYEVRLQPLPDGGVFGAIRDDTERFVAVQALKASEQRYRHIVTSCVEGIWIIDAAERTTFVNPQMASMLGYQPEEMLEKSMWDFMDEPARHTAESNLARRKRGVAEHHEFRLRKKDGSDCWTIMATSPMLDDQGQYVGASAFVTDVTERRGLELKIQHAQKLESLGVLAGGIAHDFNNLLVGILGNVAIARLELPNESPARPAIDDVQVAALRAAELTKQMLAYSGKGRFVIERLSLNRLVEEMAHLLQTVISKKAVLKYNFAANLPDIEGDATQLRQVVMNLITNASDAIGDRSGVIALSTGCLVADREYLARTYLDDRLPEGDYVFLEVSDTGIGMDAATQHKIFDPFFTTKFTGRGLGLAAVLGILRGHGGAVKVYSEAGRGSSFKVLLPCAPGAFEPKPEQAPVATVPWRGQGQLMVVDDEESVRAVARRVLEKAGFQVVTAANGKEAVQIFQERPQEIVGVILDMTMPTMNGDECFRELRRIRSDVVVILSSGYNEQDTTARFAGKGLAGFIQKPWLPADLLAVVRHALDGRGRESITSPEG
jgi:PAS domain S-box-containing protein